MRGIDPRGGNELIGKIMGRSAKVTSTLFRGGETDEDIRVEGVFCVNWAKLDIPSRRDINGHDAGRGRWHGLMLAARFSDLHQVLNDTGKGFAGGTGKAKAYKKDTST